MASPFATARSFLHRLTSDAHGTSKLVREGRRLALKDEGTHSIFAWPVMALARKLKGKERVNHALYEHFHRPLKNLDEKGGRALAKIPGADKLFRQVDVLPTTRKMEGKHALIEHETHSATAPLSKAVKFVTPLAASMWLADKTTGSEDKMASQTETQENKDALLKEAADQLELAHRQREAEKLAFAMVERCKIPAFGSWNEFQEKVASIMQKDLKIIEEALNLDSQMADFGKVAAETVPGDATAAFFHRLAE
jgi:hypothetical protein